jgi:hypothetical protein
MPILLPPSEIEKQLGLDPDGPVQRFFTETCYHHMDKYVPMDEGNLATDVDYKTYSDKIIYQVPYAHAQYIGFTTGPVENYTLTHHPLAGPYWDSEMESAEMEDVVREVQKFMEGKNGG